MDKKSFAAVMKYLAVGVGKGDMPKIQADIYYDALGDLPLESLQIAAKRILLDRVYASLPSVSELRTVALDVLTGVSEARGWQMALDFSRQGHFDDWTGGEPKSMQQRFEELPPCVQECVKAIGMRALRDMTRYTESGLRQQFARAFAETRVPAALRKQIANLPKRQLTGSAAEAVKKIGAGHETKNGRK